MPEQLSVLRWEKPPPARGPVKKAAQATVFDGIAAELREMSGIWGVIYEGPARRVAALVTRIRTGAQRCWQPAGAYEATSRLDGTNITIWVRYVGDDDAEGGCE